MNRGSHGLCGIRHFRADSEPFVNIERAPDVLASWSVVIGDQHSQ